MSPIQKAQVNIVNKIYIPKRSRNKFEVKVVNNKLTILKK